jgi:hypothetical protein
MDSNNFRSMAIAGAGVALAAFLFAYLAHDMLTTEKVAQCSSRFPGPTEFSLRSNSYKPMSPIELQARAGAFEWGVLDRGQAVEVEGAPAPIVMKVQLPKGSTSKYPEEMARGGLTFRWQPQDMQDATSACLSYSVFIPEDFKFGNGGELPGVFGGTDYEPKRVAEESNGIATRLKWSEDGKGDLTMQLPVVKGGNTPFHIDLGNFVLPYGRWFTVEQEVGLNTPGKVDGLARLWIDGELKIDRSNIMWRTTNSLTLMGAVHDVWYGGLASTATAPADASIMLTPMSISWK